MFSIFSIFSIYIYIKDPFFVILPWNCSLADTAQITTRSTSGVLHDTGCPHINTQFCYTGCPNINTQFRYTGSGCTNINTQFRYTGCTNINTQFFIQGVPILTQSFVIQNLPILRHSVPKKNADSVYKVFQKHLDFLHCTMYRVFQYTWELITQGCTGCPNKQGLNLNPGDLIRLM